MLRKYFYHYEFISVLVALFTAQIGSFFTKQTIQSGVYDAWEKSVLTPPNIVFPIVWTVIYILMGFGFGRLWRIAGSLKKIKFETVLFIAQLTLNFLWSYLFFGLQRPDLAFIEIFFLWGIITYIAFHYYKIHSFSGWCYVPYVLWVGFAIYLNYYIVMHNVTRVSTL